MAKSSSSNVAVDPAHGAGPGSADAPEGHISNSNLGSIGPVSRARRSRKPALRARLDRLYADVIAAAEASRHWFDGPGIAWRATLPPPAAAAAAIEGLAVTSRLLSLMNWLLHPAHDGQPQQLQPLSDPLPPPLPPGHPLLGTPGGDVALASRSLLARAHTLAAEHGPPPAAPALANGALLR